MAYEKMPHDGLKGFRVRSDSFWIYRRNNPDGITYLSGLATVATDHSQNGRTDILGILQRPH
jgi:hypothetical protein